MDTLTCAMLTASCLARGRRIARDEHDPRARVLERLEILLKIPRLVLAHRREGERMEHEEDVGAAAEVREPHSFGVAYRQVELGRAVTCPHRHPHALAAAYGGWREPQ